MDKIYYNANIYSIDRENRQYSAIGVNEGRIAFLGSNEEAEQMDGAEKIDLQGKTVLPGFIDSHLHMLNYAFVAKAYRMFDAQSIEGILCEGKARAAAISEDSGQWLYGRGWNNLHFMDEKRMLNRFDLDRISTQIPILFIRVCGHAAAVNSRALEIVLALPGVEQYIEQIDTAQGILTEAAIKLCYNAMSKPTVEEIKELILCAQRDFNQCGITSVQSDNFLSLPGRDRRSIVQAFKELDREKRLTVRVYEQASFTSFDDMREFIDEGCRTGQGTGFYRIGPVKLYQDGSLGAKTALLYEPYSDGTDICGTMVHDEEDLQRCVDYAYDNDMQLLIHAIGDRASDMVCTAFERAIAAYGRKKSRLAINHLQIVSPHLFDRMKQSEILAFIQPIFVASDKDIIEQLIGPERAGRAYGWKTMMDHGLLCCGSSDSPVENYDILAGIQAAVTRTGLEEKSQGWRPEERLSVLEALRLFTINNAYGSFEEKEKGSLELGKAADFVVLGEDPFAVSQYQLAKIPVLRTIVEGRDVYIA